MKVAVKCIFNYFRTLLDVWSDWNDTILVGNFSADTNTLTEALGITTSDGRSRANEIYRIGLLNIKLTIGQKGLNKIREGINVQSDLGYICALLSKAYNKQETVKVTKALSAVCSIFSILQSIEIDENEYSINWIIQRLNEAFPCPVEYDFRTWHRYVLSAFLCELGYRQDHQHSPAKEEENSTFIKRFLDGDNSHFSMRIVTNEKNGYQLRHVISKSEDVAYAIKTKISLTNIIQQKTPLFIFGQEKDIIPKGFYGMALKCFNNFLTNAYLLESYNHSAFVPLFDENDKTTQKSNVLEYLSSIFLEEEETNNTFKDIMKTIYEGAMDALNILNVQRNKRSITDISASYVTQYLSAIRCKPFILLAGISGTGKSRIVRKLAQATDNITTYQTEAERWSNQRPENFELVQVKPNWHNSMDVVGYKSNIGHPHYEFTPFIEFIAKAWLYPDTPFFLCLDEMNLAPVEEYFAEFLSAIESRSYSKNNEYETDPIIKPFKAFDDDESQNKLSDSMIAHLIGSLDTDLKRTVATRFREKGLTLPQNLIVMGTVNMDDTTFSFSRKVLDRAMSFEMNDVNLDAFLFGTSENDIPVLVKDNSLLISRPVSSSKVRNNVDAEAIISYLKAINEFLEGTPFKLGYRAANEALLYAAASKDFNQEDLIGTLDEFTNMKILSRLEGDETRLAIDDSDRRAINFPNIKDKYGQKTILGGLRNIILQEFMKLGYSPSEDANRILVSIDKLDKMIDTLHRDHFVSYWS